MIGFDKHRQEKQKKKKKKSFSFWGGSDYEYGLSSSNWENSHYGGYWSLIMDHPDIEMPYKLDVDIKDNQGLSYYTANKLMKIFLYRVKDLHLIKTLTDNASVGVITKFGFDKEVLMINKDSLYNAFCNVCSASKEHANLFYHYKDLILSSEISIPFNPPGGAGAAMIMMQKKEEENEQEENEDNDSEGQGQGEEGEKEDKEKTGNSGRGKNNQEGEGEGEEESEGEGGGNGENEEEEEGDGEGDGEGEDGKENGEKGKKPGKKSNSPEYSSSGENKTNPFGEQFELAIREIQEFLGQIKKREIVSYKYISGDFSKTTQWKQQPDRDKCKFTTDEEFYAGRLCNMLDINFDPTSDRINSLRTGKLDPRKLAEVVPGNTNVYYVTEENQSTKPFTVVILQDESGSMGSGYKIEYSKTILKTLYLAFSEILPEDKLYVYGHSGNQSPTIFVYQDKYNPKFEERIDNLSHRDGNYDGPAIEAIYEKIRSITDDNIIFITLSDGQPAGRGYGGHGAAVELKKIVEKCRRDRFVTVGIGIEYDTGHLYDYNYTIKDRITAEEIMRVTRLINDVVKKEFK